MRYNFSRSVFTAHLLAAVGSLFYAWSISQTAYQKTGLQFVAPLVVVVAVHLVWNAIASRGWQPGFSILVYRRSFHTVFAMAGALFFTAVVAPIPAEASVQGALGGIMVFVFCAGGIVAVAVVLALIFRASSWVGTAVLNLFRKDDGPQNRLFDFGSIALVGGLLAFGSMEGLPNSYSFAPNDQSSTSRLIKASPTHVWRVMETATSPSFPLPAALSLFPQPVAVVIDEGTALGAKRKVKIQGREGVGYLTLKVVERSDSRAVFKVLSDSSPHTNWVKFDKLIYQVRQENDFSRLTVTLEYERLLAPTLVFKPVVKSAAYLAMDVLARDVQSRSEE